MATTMPPRFLSSSTRKRSREEAIVEAGQSVSAERNVKRQLWSGRGITVQEKIDSGSLQSAQAALHLSAVPEKILCRSTQRDQVIDFCKKCIEQGKAGSLYVCGCPGTGKSITMGEVKHTAKDLLQEVAGGTLQLVDINCMSLNNPQQIFQRILDTLGEQGQQAINKVKNKVAALKELKDLMKFSKSQKEQKDMVLIIVDEMDHLATKDFSVLYELFLLPTLPDSRCILIGVANAIDLTDRFLPKLKEFNCNPDVITFPAYDKEQIFKLLQQRLEASKDGVFETRALELCARKVAASSGDMRIALDVCRTALGLAEADMVSSSTQECDSNMASGNQGEQPVGAKSVVQVRVDQMARALTGSFKSPVIEIIRALPQHQQMVLCSAVRLFRRRKKDDNLGKLNEAYGNLCKQTAMRPLTAAEFSGMCTVLADQALLSIGGGREERLRRVTMKVQEDDVTFALQGVRFFRNILHDNESSKLNASIK